MTRINCGIPPAELTDKHLLAEHRELKRIPNAVRTGKAVIKNIPQTFRLGEGHVKFFYDKMQYLRKRQQSLYEECRRRGFNVTDFREAFADIPLELWNDYRPTKNDKALIRARITERLKQ